MICPATNSVGNWDSNSGTLGEAVPFDAEEHPANAATVTASVVLILISVFNQ
jgi:hypothetical protein